MRSFLLEYKKRNNSQSINADIDLHVNLWSRNSHLLDNTPMPILDFGFMINNIEDVSHIILYCPFHIEKVDDLGKLLSSKPKLVEAIFNENCEVSSMTYPNRVKIIKKGDDFRCSSGSENTFNIYQLDPELISIRDERIQIDVSGILSGNECSISPLYENKRYYFRIRITPKDSISILKRENEDINIFEDSSLRTTEIIDFRINDFRSITENLREEALRLNIFSISSIHYLIMRNSTDEFVSGMSEYKSRLLEKEVWEEYIKLNKNDVIAYHFKNKLGEKISSFSNLSRFKYPLNVMSRLCRYIIAIVILSILSNMMYDFIMCILSQIIDLCRNKEGA